MNLPLIHVDTIVNWGCVANSIYDPDAQTICPLCRGGSAHSSVAKSFPCEDQDYPEPFLQSQVRLSATAPSILPVRTSHVPSPYFETAFQVLFFFSLQHRRRLDKTSSPGQLLAASRIQIPAPHEKKCAIEQRLRVLVSSFGQEGNCMGGTCYSLDRFQRIEAGTADPLARHRKDLRQANPGPNLIGFSGRLVPRAKEEPKTFVFLRWYAALGRRRASSPFIDMSIEQTRDELSWIHVLHQLDGV